MDELPSPWLLKDMKKAVEIIREKVRQKKKIRIIGDYDIDGVTSTYILIRCFQKIGAQADTYIPDRVADGYGIHDHLIKKALEDKIDTIVTCDNGIAAAAEIEMAKEAGCKTMNGLGMMLFQGSAAFELWTGEPMPIEYMKETLGIDYDE